MNIQPNFIQKCLFTMALLVPSLLYAQVTKECFKARIQTPVKEMMNVHLTSSDTIPLKHLGTIYALCIDATIEQPREASFVRIVLEDTEGHNYLVAESDWFRNDTTTVQLSEYCEETAQLNGVTPLRLKCYLTNASLQLTGIHTSTEQPKRALANDDKKLLKENQVQNIVDRINNYNTRHEKMWKAGMTGISLLQYEHRDSLLMRAQDPYLSNFAYYIGGLYEFGEYHQLVSERPTNFVPTFSWRNRHGTDWITGAKDQLFGAYCVTFAVVGMAESLVNLYYNRHLDLDLSEQDIISYSNGTPTLIKSSEFVANYIVENGVIDEATLEYGASAPSTRPVGLEKIYASSALHSNLGFGMSYSLDTLRSSLLKKGPFSLCIDGSPGHEVLLVGYDQLTSNNSFGLDEDDPRLGRTYLIVKNSWGQTWGETGFANVLFNNPTYLTDCCSMSVPIIRRNHSDSDVACEDLDGDGYFNWGIGSRPNDRLPAWAEQEEDGDDSNPLKGPMTNYGFITDIDYPSTFVISHNMTDTELTDSISCRFIRSDIRINTGVTLTIQGDLAFYADKKIYLNQNSTLIIDGGTLVDPTLSSSGIGGTVKIINGGKIQRHKSPQFILPDGISLEMDEGSIFE